MVIVIKKILYKRCIFNNAFILTKGTLRRMKCLEEQFLEGIFQPFEIADEQGDKPNQDTNSGD